MARIFISYKRIDKDRVTRVTDRIQNELNEPCWMDVDEIESDAQFVSVIIKAIDDAEVFLFMYSKAHSIIENYATDWTIRELNYAQERKKRIVFVNIDGVALTSWFLFMFPQKQQINAQHEEEITKLIKNIRQWLNIGKNNMHESDLVIKNDHPIYAKQVEKIVFSVLDESFSMIKINKGHFYMGTVFPNTTHALIDDIPNSHHVIITKDYYLGETSVTQGLWETVMGQNPSCFKNKTHPVDSVSWDDCQMFIKRLNSILEKRFRLPTEAEWEYAARGGVLSQCYLYSGSNRIGDVAWYNENSMKKTHPVKQKAANELGLYDMSGNVWEWCQDYYEDYERVTLQDPQGPSLGIYRVYKGGCWCEEEDCRVTARRKDKPGFTSYGGLGFRLAMSE